MDVILKARGRGGPGRGAPALLSAAMLAVVFALGSAACSTGPHAHRASRSTATTLSGIDQAVIRGWKAAEDAFYSASYTSDSTSPALAATMVNPALRQAVTLLFAEHHDGYVGRGTYDLGHPQVLSLTGTQAVVSSCVYDGVIEVDTATGKSAPGVLGVAERAEVRSTLVQASAGLWKVSQRSVKEGSCAGS